MLLRLCLFAVLFAYEECFQPPKPLLYSCCLMCMMLLVECWFVDKWARTGKEARVEFTRNERKKPMKDQKLQHEKYSECIHRIMPDFNAALSPVLIFNLISCTQKLLLIFIIFWWFCNDIFIRLHSFYTFFCRLGNLWPSSPLRNSASLRGSLMFIHLLPVIC